MDSKGAKKVELEVCKLLGIRRNGLSGGKWPYKEDGGGRFDDDEIIQIKATDGNALSVKRVDVEDLMRNARRTGSRGLFILYFNENKATKSSKRILVAMDIDEYLKLRELEEK